MSHTNSTTNYKLPQFIGSDKPGWLTDVNTAYKAIDDQMKLNADAAATNKSSIDSNKSAYDSFVSSQNTRNSTFASQIKALQDINTNEEWNTTPININFSSSQTSITINSNSSAKLYITKDGKYGFLTGQLNLINSKSAISTTITLTPASVNYLLPSTEQTLGKIAYGETIRPTTNSNAAKTAAFGVTTVGTKADDILKNLGLTFNPQNYYVPENNYTYQTSTTYFTTAGNFVFNLRVDNYSDYCYDDPLETSSSERATVYIDILPTLIPFTAFHN